MDKVLAALLATEDAPTNYGLTVADVAGIATSYDWDARWQESGWTPGTVEYDTLAEMVAAEPAEFLADISRYYGDDYYTDADADDEGDAENDEGADWMDGDHESALESAYGPNG